MNNIFSFLTQNFSFAVSALKRNKRRTALSLVGIVVGVFAVFLVLSLGNGVRQFVLGQVDTFGADLLQVEVKVPNTGKFSNDNASGRSQGIQITTLTQEDAEALQALPNIRALYAGTLGQEKAIYKETSKHIFLFGTGYQAPEVDSNLVLTEGRFFTEEEESASDKVVVLGSRVKEDFFGEGEALGEKITMKGERYRVIGVIASRGTAGFVDLDSFVYIPVTTLQNRILGVDYVQMISVRMKDPTQETATIQDIEALLRSRHDIDDPEKDDFSVTSTEEAKEVIGTTLAALTWLLLTLTAISLVVGGVGIMNVLYVSVAERTQEIGLRKAVGATRKAILTQFLIEALLTTLLGGVVGIGLGVLVAYGLSVLAANMGYAVAGIFTPGTFGIALAFAFFVGMVFGLAPAFRASSLSPIEALRKE